MSPNCFDKTMLMVFLIQEALLRGKRRFFRLQHPCHITNTGFLIRATRFCLITTAATSIDLPAPTPCPG